MQKDDEKSTTMFASLTGMPSFNTLLVRQRDACSAGMEISNDRGPF